MGNSQLDDNSRPTLTGISSTDGSVIPIYADPITHRLLVDLAGNANLTIGTSIITSGSNGKILYDNNGVVGELTNNFLTSVTPHNLLSTTHGDTTASSATRGYIITGQGAGTAAWAALAFPASPIGKILQATATDVAWSTNPLTIGASASVAGSNTGDQDLTHLVASTDTGLSVPAISGNNGKVLGLTTGALAWVAGGSGGGITDITYANLVTAIGGSTLTAGSFYRITDYATKHYIVDGNNHKIKQVDTITLTGTSGTANVTGAGGLTKLATFHTDLTTTASDFVSAWATAYLAQGIVLTSSTIYLIFTAQYGGIGFTHPVITNVTTNLAGSVANTQLNDGVITGTTEPLIVMATDVNKLDKQAYSQTYPQDIIYYDWNPLNWMVDLSFANAEANPATAIISGFTGVIYFRHDTILDNYMGYDFRAVKFRRWKASPLEWADMTVYTKSEFVKVTGDAVYQALKAVPNTPSIPVSNTDYWVKLLDLSYTQYWNAAPTIWRGITSDTVYTDVKTFAEGATTATYLYCCRSNHFESFKDGVSVWYMTGTILMNNVFWLTASADYTVYANQIGSPSFCNTIVGNFCSNTIATDFQYNMINSIGGQFNSNTLNDEFVSNIIGVNFYSNIIGTNFYSNTCGHDFCFNTIGNNFDRNIIGDNFTVNAISNNVYQNAIGHHFYFNTTGNFFWSNAIGNYFYYNTIGNGFYSNTIGNTFQYNTIGNNFNTITFGDNYSYKDLSYNSQNFNNPVTVVANAATVPVTYRMTTITNSATASSATTITITTSGAIDGQLLLVRWIDTQATQCTLTWSGTENSGATIVPAKSTGVNNNPTITGFIFNGATSLWRCIAKDTTL